MKNRLAANRTADISAVTTFFTTAAGGSKLHEAAVSKVSRPQSRLVHPDKGGSTELQSLLNTLTDIAHAKIVELNLEHRSNRKVLFGELAGNALRVISHNFPRKGALTNVSDVYRTHAYEDHFHLN